MADKETDDLIANLSGELEETKPLKHPIVRLAPWVLLVFIYVVYIVYDTGLRSDLDQRLNDSVFLYEVISAGLIAVFAAMASLWLCVPDMRGQRWVVAIPNVLCANFILWVLIKAYVEGMHLPKFHVDHCMFEGFYMMAIPAAALMFISYRGSTTHPYLMAFTNMMSASFIAYLGLRFTCMMDEIGHSFVYHIVPFVLLGTFVGALARRIYKW